MLEMFIEIEKNIQLFPENYRENWLKNSSNGIFLVLVPLFHLAIYRYIIIIMNYNFSLTTFYWPLEFCFVSFFLNINIFFSSNGLLMIMTGFFNAAPHLKKLSFSFSFTYYALSSSFLLLFLLFDLTIFSKKKNKKT